MKHLFHELVPAFRRFLSICLLLATFFGPAAYANDPSTAEDQSSAFDKWSRSWNSASSKASRNNTLLVVMVIQDGCETCKKTAQYMADKKLGNRLIVGAEHLVINTSTSGTNLDLAQQMGVTITPTIIVYGPKGKGELEELTRHTGSLKDESLSKIRRAVAKQTGRSPSLAQDDSPSTVTQNRRR